MIYPILHLVFGAINLFVGALFIARIMLSGSGPEFACFVGGACFVFSTWCFLAAYRGFRDAR